MRGESQRTLTNVGLPVPVSVPVALLLLMASWLRGRDLALLILRCRGPRRVAATSGLAAQRFERPAGYGNYPPLCSALRCDSVAAGLLCLLRAACLFVRHVFDRKSRT